MMEKQKENRDIDMTRARGEQEEDLLEFVYRMWRHGEKITA